MFSGHVRVGRASVSQPGVDLCLELLSHTGLERCVHGAERLRLDIAFVDCNPETLAESVA